MKKVDPHRRMLYARWAQNRAILAAEWQDYAVFEAWAMANGWTPDCTIAWRKNKIGICGPETARIIPPRCADDAEITPGWSNRPCASCPREASGKSHNICGAYLAWYNATMAAYRRALGMGEHKDE